LLMASARTVGHRVLLTLLPAISREGTHGAADAKNILAKFCRSHIDGNGGEHDGTAGATASGPDMDVGEGERPFRAEQSHAVGGQGEYRRIEGAGNHGVSPPEPDVHFVGGWDSNRS